MSNEATIEPCPFCGEASGVLRPTPAPGLHALRQESDIHYVHCESCGADGPATDLVEAIAAWNKRSNQPAGEVKQAMRGKPKEEITLDDLRSKTAAITHDALPRIGKTYDMRGRARCQVEIMDAVERLFQKYNLTATETKP